MVAAALAARVVEVIADLGAVGGSRYRYGSGCIVRGKIVLTAAHVVTGAESVLVRDRAKREYTATADPQFIGDAGGPAPDLALLEINDPAFDRALPPIGLAAVDRDSAVGEAVERCHAIGYPWFGETQSRIAVRDTVDAIGVVPVLSKLAAGLLSVQLTIAPRALPPQEIALGASEWSGMSGAPVVAAGCLLGVVSEHAPREGPSTITAVPLTALQADPAHAEWGSGVVDPSEWWSRLGVAGSGDLRRLPVPPLPRPEPAYRASLRRLGQTLHQRMPQLLGRDRELADIAAFATGGAGYRWLVGGPFAGKTALLYEAVTAGLPDEVDVVCYFMSRRASDASSDRFLAAVVPQLAYLCEVDPPVADVDQYHTLWQQASDRAARGGRHLLLVVDGLDEDLLPPGSPSVASLLPIPVGARTHVVVASRPHPELPDDVPAGHPLRVAPTQLSPFPGALELADLAKKEVNDLTHADDADLAVHILGLLTAAAGSLSVTDLVALRSDGHDPPTIADRLHVRRLVEDRAARSLEPVGPADGRRYQFAHSSLLEYAQTNQDLRNPEYRQRIHDWAERWRDAGWPTAADGEQGTPRYLLDTYPATLAHDLQRLGQLAGDIGWVSAAITSTGIDPVLADLRHAADANLSSNRIPAVLVTVVGQAHNLRPPRPLDQPGYNLRQLWMQAAELAEHDLAADIRGRLQPVAGPCLVPRWTTRLASPALTGELGRHEARVLSVAVLADGRMVSGGDDGRVLLWDPTHPGAEPAELGHHGWTEAVAVLADGRVVTAGSWELLIWDPGDPGAGPVQLGRHSGSLRAVTVLGSGRVIACGDDGRMLVWDPAHPGTAQEERFPWAGVARAMTVLPDGRLATGSSWEVLVWDLDDPGTEPAKLGSHDGPAFSVAVLADDRVVSGGYDGRVLAWDPDAPGGEPVELGRHDSSVRAVAVLADGRVVSGGDDARVLLWNPARRGTGRAAISGQGGEAPGDLREPSGSLLTGRRGLRLPFWRHQHRGLNLSGRKPAGRGPGSEGRSPQHHAPVWSVALLADGRIVTGGRGPVLLWDAAQPGTGPAELGRHEGYVMSVAVLADRRVVTSGQDGDEGRVLMWNPDRPGRRPVELGRREGWVGSVAVLPDGRVVGGGEEGRVLVWDPAHPGKDPAELGSCEATLRTVAVLADGRVFTGGGDFDDGSMLIWDPADPAEGPVVLPRGQDVVRAAAALPDGRVVTGDESGQVLLWDPTEPDANPSELGRHEGVVHAVAALSSGLVISGGADRRVLVWDLAEASTPAVQLSCSVTVLATAPLGPGGSNLVIAHQGSGFSLWSFSGIIF